MGIPPRNINIMLEPNPLKSRILVWRLTVSREGRTVVRGSVLYHMFLALSKARFFTRPRSLEVLKPGLHLPTTGRGDDTIGNPHRVQIDQFELFEFILLLKLEERFPIEQFEATLSQSIVPSPSLKQGGPRDLCLKLRASFRLPASIVGARFTVPKLSPCSQGSEVHFAFQSSYNW